LRREVVAKNCHFSLSCNQLGPKPRAADVGGAEFTR
jgi:hypothetical protein